MKSYNYISVAKRLPLTALKSAPNSLRTSTLRSLTYGGALLGLCAVQAHAAGTIAGSDINNTAEASYTGADGATILIPSNTVTIIVDELLDVTVTSQDSTDVSTQPGQTDEVLTFQVTNIGNGQESFRLTANTAVGGDDFDPSLQQIVIDSNGNGVYDPGVDTVYVAGTNDPVLEPDTSAIIFVITTTPSNATDGQRAEVSLTAEANTGTGAPGTSFDGLGQGGGDAVVGLTGADDDDSGFLAVQQALIALVKSATVVDPFGGSRAVPGSVITYNLVATISGTGTLNDVIISDPIPASTIYNPSTLTLETNALTDEADLDQGSFDGTSIAVDIGTVAAGETRTVTFEVTVE